MARGVVAAGVRATFGVMTVIYASPRGNDRNDGSTPETPVSRVRAFASAAPGVKVELANGVYDDALGYTYKTDEGVLIHMSVASQRRLLARAVPAALVSAQPANRCCAPGAALYCGPPVL